MTRQGREYHRLPGRGLHLMGRSTLWLGPDHLLAVEGRGYSEDYRRFYYRDIQAIVSARTSRWLAVAAILGLGLSAAGFAFFTTASDIRWLWAIPGVPILVLFLANFLYGPTCICRITTAVQTVRLPSLRRSGIAHRAMSRIRERVEAEQGAFAGETLSGDSPQAQIQLASPAPARPLPGLPQSVAGLPARDNARLHQLLFWSLIVDGVLTIVSLAMKKNGLDVAGFALLLVEFALAVAAIVKQRRTDIPQGIRSLVWASFVYLCLSVAMTFFLFWFAAVQVMQHSGAGLAPGHRILAFDVFGVVAPLLLGTSGLVLLHRFSSDRQETDLSLFSRS